METAENLSTENAEKPASETPESKGKVKTIVKKLAKRWFIDAFSGMAMGLFATLIAGTIIYQIGDWSGNNAFGNTLKLIGNFAKTLMGAGIGVGIAHKLNAKPLVVFTAAVCGLLGAWAGELVSALVAGGDYSSLLDGKLAIVFKNGLPGNPIGSYVVALFAIEIAELYAGKTKFDIILIPLGMLLLTFGAIFIAWPFIQLVNLIAKVLVLAVNAGTGVKILTGILVAVVMGILLTMPTSSAAIWIAIATSATAIENPEAFSIAGGAAVAGCAAHMVGFAVASFRENGFGGLISQGLGTSMLQIPNIMKKPVIMVPEIIASAIAGFVAVLFDMRCNASGGGMGTSGLVGVFGVIDASTAAGVMAYKYVLGIVLTMFVIPAFVCFFASEFMRKKGWIVLGDQKLE
ncbi:MAG: PTS sugar transporter subunit IIC [Clostridia bacterium]|nr:PTS sugar transporter subunit IIC [Clostridia bacterium]